MSIKQYKITSKSFAHADIPDCVLSPTDSIHEIKKENFLGSLSDSFEVEVYNVYPDEDGTDRPKLPYGQH